MGFRLVFIPPNMKNNNVDDKIKMRDYYNPKKSRYDFIGLYHNGLAYVRLYDKYGFINREGEIVIPLEYEYAHDFIEGLAAVRLNGKWGFIDTVGNMVIPFKYDDVGDFKNGKVDVIMNGEHFVINKNGVRLN